MSLVRTFDSYVHELASAAYCVMKDDYQNVIETLKEKVNTVDAYEQELQALKGMETDENDEQRIEKLEVLVYQGKKWKFLSQRFDKWLKQLPVIGFNSGRFDLNLIKEYFIPHLLDRNQVAKASFQSKRGTPSWLS